MEVLSFLLAQDGINLDIQDNEGWTPFHAAVCWEQQEVMKKLAEKGANMDIRNLHGETAYGAYTHMSICLSVCLEKKKENGRNSEVLQDLNPQHSALYADALLTELRSSASKSMSIGSPYREHFSFQG